MTVDTLERTKPITLSVGDQDMAGITPDDVEMFVEQATLTIVDKDEAATRLLRPHDILAVPHAVVLPGFKKAKTYQEIQRETTSHTGVRVYTTIARDTVEEFAPTLDYQPSIIGDRNPTHLIKRAGEAASRIHTLLDSNELTEARTHLGNLIISAHDVFIHTSEGQRHVRELADGNLIPVYVRNNRSGRR